MDISFLIGSDNSYIDDLYQQFMKDPNSVEPGWQAFFKGYLLAEGQDPKAPLANGHAAPATTTVAANDQLKELAVLQLIQRFRERGHLLSTTNPIRPRKDRSAGLAISNFGLTESDLKQEFAMSAETRGNGKTLEDIIKYFSKVYCGNIGLEFMHVEDLEARNWLQNEFESTANDYNFSVDKKKRILNKLNEAVVFENFLGTKYVGQKRFSLEGGENAIVALDTMINQGADLGVKEFVIGMAHRGRLNVLANIMGKTYEYIFSEFEGQEFDQSMGDGDVKYHLGFTTELITPSGKDIFLKLMPNPSHLETVGPVVTGYARSKGDILYNEKQDQVLPILIHGDSAVAGQGVCYELAQMSKLPGYYNAGTIHFVINNQIGFTTDFDEARSSTYCTSPAYVANSPVIHVNGDDAEAVVYAVELATRYRQKFKTDIYIDMVCYRKHGHNEGDEPKYTQPNLYKLISKHKNPREVYIEQLTHGGQIEAQLAKTMQKEFKQLLQDRLNMVKQKALPFHMQAPDKAWQKLRKSRPEDYDHSPDTSVKKEILETVTKALTTLPDNIRPIKKAFKLIDDRKSMFENDKLDWAMGELLAYGSLLLEGHDVRLSGQDCVRGTFSHRHSGFFDEETKERYINLNHIGSKQGKLRVFNSLLSEYAVLGYEYGYSLGHPDTLTIWEAQFGDFSNTAQTVIDQFICSAESKWQVTSGIVMYLPHGYEGQGPEHSSAKPERYLQLCAEFNMVAANVTTPANFFHLIRRQLTFPFRVPLIVFTPKSLLRHPMCISSVKELTDGKFEEIIDDTYCDKKKVKKVLLCTGKIYYDLLERQQADKRKDVAIIRMEQLHPIPFERVDKMLSAYKGAKFHWVQEEPKNMGYWNYILRKLDYYDLEIISRKSSASPATGYPSLHKREQQEIIDKSFK